MSLSQYVLVEDLVEYCRAKNIKQECPMCESPGWYAGVGLEPHGNFAIPQLAVNEDNTLPPLSYTPPHVPIVMIGCINCGYIRQFFLGAVVDWLNKRGQNSVGQ